MLIPSIDLMSGRIVQLVQGEKKALAFDDFETWIEKFSHYPLVQLIDLDAAKGEGDNRELIRQFMSRLPCQVGGGIRTLDGAREMIALGAQRVIMGSSLFREGKIQTDFARVLSDVVGPTKLCFGVDSKQGKVAIHGWRTLTGYTAVQAMQELDHYCGAFLYTNVDTEGLMQGFPMDLIPELKAATHGKLIVAGGITTMEEIKHLDNQNVDAVVGMAIYTGRISI